MYIIYHLEWSIILSATARLLSFDASRALTRKQEQDEILRFEVCGRGDRRGAQIGGLPRRVRWTGRLCSGVRPPPQAPVAAAAAARAPCPRRPAGKSALRPRHLGAVGGWFRQVVAPTGGGMATGRGGGYLVAADARARRRRRRRSPWWRRRLCRRE
jgi:hypothetical protein